MVGGAQFRLAQVDDNFLDLARKFERHIIVQAHGCSRVLAHVEGFIKGEAQGHGPVDPPLGDLFPSTLIVPVPPLPIPPPSYWKSKTMVCLPGFRASLA